MGKTQTIYRGNLKITVDHNLLKLGFDKKLVRGKQKNNMNMPDLQVFEDGVPSDFSTNFR